MRLIPRAVPLAFVLSITAAAAGAQAPAPAAASAPPPVPKIAYIRSQVILEQAPGRAAAEKQFEQEMGNYRQQVQRMGDSLNTLIADYTKQEASLTPAVKETRQRTIREKEEQYQRKTQELQQQAQQRQVELVEPIMKQINQIINEIRRADGYAMIFDASSNSGVVVAADTTLDITSRVIERLKTAPPAPAAAKPAPGPAKPPGAPTSAPAAVSRPKTPPTR
jgi:outer membrane protein